MVDVFNHHPDALPESDGGQRKVGAAHLEGRQADEHPGHGCQHASHQHAKPGTDPILERQYRRRVSTDADEGGVPKRQHPGKTAHKVPTGGQIGIEINQNENMEIRRAADKQRQCQRNHHHQGQGDVVNRF